MKQKKMEVDSDLIPLKNRSLNTVLKSLVTLVLIKVKQKQKLKKEMILILITVLKIMKMKAFHKSNLVSKMNSKNLDLINLNNN